MKILVLTDLFPTPDNPNHGVFIFQWAYHLAKKVDMTVYQVVWGNNNNPISEQKTLNLYNNLVDTKITFKWIQRKMKYFLIDRIWIRNIQFVKQTKKNKNLSVEGFDIVIGQMGCPGGYVAVKIAKKYNKPSIVGVRGSDVTHYLKVPILKKQSLWAYRNCNHIVVVCEDLKEKIIKYGINKTKISVIKNGINPIFQIHDRIKSKKELNISLEKRVILFVGHLIPLKGINYLIESLSFLKNNNYKLYIIGSGEEKFKLQRLILGKDLSSYVEFIGDVKHSDLVQWYNAADVFCLPSLREGIPNVILESLACGTPVVTTDISNNSDIINKYNGILVEPKNSKHLAIAIKEVLSNNWDRTKISKSVNNFSWIDNSRKYFELISKIICNEKYI